MKKQLLVCTLVLSQNLWANTSLKCDWIETSEHAENYFVASSLDFQINEDSEQVNFTNDTFLNRQYSPCWVGNFSSCSFSFSHNSDIWEIDSLSNNTLHLSTDAAYWDAELKLTFQDNLDSLRTGDEVSMILSGDDGDGTWIQSEFFNCKVVK
ncbi:MAG: hypothetical protein CME60_05600 [Halobacteriovoraceae bacterium]|nr:hypothetical protein [Halobacteriovoraceae bacterium]